MEGADKESWVAIHTKTLNELGQGNIMSALNEIEEAELTTVRGLFGFKLVGVDIYLSDSGRDGKDSRWEGSQMCQRILNGTGRDDRIKPCAAQREK